MKATQIEWETDNNDVYLPTEVDIPENIVDVADYLSERFGWLVKSLFIK